MGEARTRTDLRRYPGCLSEVQKPVDGGWNKTWAEAEAWAQGAESSGKSGVIRGGIILCSSTAADFNTWGTGI